MVSKKQWAVIILVSLYGFVNGASSGGPAFMLGSAVGMGVVAYAVVLGYNGVSLTSRIKRLASRSD